jgi:hypothetical protein
VVDEDEYEEMIVYMNVGIIDSYIAPHVQMQDKGILISPSDSGYSSIIILLLSGLRSQGISKMQRSTTLLAYSLSPFYLKQPGTNHLNIPQSSL